MAISLKAARINKGYTQDEAAKEIGVNVNTVRKCEQNVRSARLDVFEKLCKLYEVKMDDIFLS